MCNDSSLVHLLLDVLSLMRVAKANVPSVSGQLTVVVVVPIATVVVCAAARRASRDEDD